jgi:hypothetical protein
MVHQTVYKSVSCDGPNCPNKITYEAGPQGNEQQVQEETPWLKTVRLVQRADQTTFVYCSDACELANVGAGEHNPKARKQIILPQGANAMKQAESLAKTAEAATKALKSGSGITVQGS